MTASRQSDNLKHTHTHTPSNVESTIFLHVQCVPLLCVPLRPPPPHPAHQTTPRPPDPHTHPPPTRASKGLVHAGVKSPTPGESLVFISNFHKFLMKCCEVVVRPFARQARCEGLFSSVAGQMWPHSTTGWTDRERERETPLITTQGVSPFSFIRPTLDRLLTGYRQGLNRNQAEVGFRSLEFIGDEVCVSVSLCVSVSVCAP